MKNIGRTAVIAETAHEGKPLPAQITKRRDIKTILGMNWLKDHHLTIRNIKLYDEQSEKRAIDGQLTLPSERTKF